MGFFYVQKFVYLNKILNVADLSYLILNITDSSLIEKINNYSIENVSDEDLSDKGRETDYHMTLLANIKTDSELPFKILNGKSVNVELGKVSIFENEENDVLKIEVKKSEQLVNLYNKLVNEVDNEVEYDFNPHITIAYIKKGVCKELINDNEFEGQKIKFDLAKFSPDDENEVVYRKLAKVFHKEIGFPKGMGEKLMWFLAELNSLPVSFTKHYYDNEERTQSVDNFFKYVQIKISSVFEITTDNNQRILKVACRIPFGDGRDIVFSVSSEKKIITFWFNDMFDTHTTLDKSKYDYAMKKKSSLTGYGGWLSPQGEFFPVEEPQAHDDWARRNRKKLKIKSDDNNYVLALIEKGWIRIVIAYSSFLDIGLYNLDYKTCRLIDNFIYDNNLYNTHPEIRVDDYYTYKSYVISKQEYEENDFSLKSAIDHARDIRGIKKKSSNGWIENGKWQTLTTDKYKFIVAPEYIKGSKGKIGSWAVMIKDLTDLVKEYKGGFETKNQAKKYAVDKYLNNNIKQSSKSTSLKLVSYTDLARVEKLLDSLKYHSFKYRIDGDSLVFDDIDELQDVKTLLDSYGIGNLIKTSKTEDNIEVDHWDFDGRESYSFTLNDDGKELASLQTETYDEGRHGIFDIEVNKNYRRKGLATKLFYYAKEYLNNLGIELVHSNNLSDEGRKWKSSLAGTYVNWNDLKTLKDFLKQYLNGKTTGANISELDSIYDYKEIINWVYKNAKKEVGLISKLSKYRWRPSQKQRKEFKEMMQDPEKKHEYDLEKAERDIKKQEAERKRQEKNRNNSKFNYDTAGGYYIPTKAQYDFSINNVDKGTIEQQQAMNEVINGYMDDDKIHHDYIHIVNEMIRNEFSNKQSKKFVYLNKNNYEMKNIKAIKNKLSSDSYTDDTVTMEEYKELLDGYEIRIEDGSLPFETELGVVYVDFPKLLADGKVLVENLADGKHDKMLEDLLHNMFLNEGLSYSLGIKNKLSISEEHLNEDADRFEKIDDEADNIKDEIDELQKDDKKIKSSRYDSDYKCIECDSMNTEYNKNDDTVYCYDCGKEQDPNRMFDDIFSENDINSHWGIDEDIIKSSLKKIASSRIDGEAWIRGWLDIYDVQSDAQVKAILESDYSREEKEKKIGERVKEILSSLPTEDLEIVDTGNFETEVDWEEVNSIIDDYEEDLKTTEWVKNNSKKSNKDEFKYTHNDVSDDKLQNILNKWKKLYGDVRTDYFDSPNHGKIIYIYYGKTHIGTYVSGEQILYCDTLMDDILRTQKSMKKKSKMEFPNSKNSIIRNVTIWENGSGTEYINNYNYEEDLTDEGIPLQWDYKTLPQEIMDYIYDSGAMDDLGDDYDFGGMDIGFIGNGTTTVNMFRYDSKLKLEHPPRKIKTLGEDYDDMETTNMKKSMKKISQNLNQNEIYILEKLYNMDDKEAIFIPQMNMKKAKENYPMLIKKKYIHIPTLKYTGGFSITREGRDFIESLKNKKSMKKITAIDKYGHEDVYDLEPEMIVSLEDISDDDEMYPENAEHWNMININQSKEVIETQLMEQINQDFPRDLTYESIFQTAINTGLVDNMDRYNIIGVLNNVAINLGLPRTSWDEFFPKDDIINEIDLHGTDGSITFDEDGEFSPESIINNYDNDADSLFTIDRILDERLKHFINTDELIVESSTVVKSAMTNLKRKQAYVKKYKLGNLHIGDTDRAGRILNGDITYNILLRSVKNRDVEKVIEVTLPIKARRVEMPKTFKFKQDEYPLENYYITDILEQ